MNICLTNKCNRKCEYCMWKNWFSANDTKIIYYMDTKIVETILSFFGREKKYRLCGGEPFLHPDIEQILSVFAKAGEQVAVRTTLGCDDSVLKNITEHYRDYIDCYEINLDYSEEEEEGFYRKLFDCVVNKVNMHIFITLVPDSEAIRKSFAKIKKFLSFFVGSKPPVELCFKSPIMAQDYQKYDYTADLVDNIMDVVKDNENVEFLIEQPMGYCEVNRAYLETVMPLSQIIKFHPHTVSCVCDRHEFYIMPDKTLILCPAYHTAKILDFENLGNAEDVFDKLREDFISSYQNYCYDDICRACKLFNPGLCTSWCGAKRAFLKTDR